MLMPAARSRNPVLAFLALLIGGWLGALPTHARTPPPPPPTDTATLRISRLPAQGLLLDKGWHYHAGDNPAWARPDFDDRAWDTINPTRPRQELPPALQTGISWLRLRFRLSDSLRLRTLVLQAWELGASEFYLNGRLILRQGIVAADPAQVRPRGVNVLPGEVPAAGPAAGQVLAVRYAPWQPPVLFGIRQWRQLQVRLFEPQQYWEYVLQGRAVSSVFLVAMGIFGLLTLLHLAFLHYNPAQQANRYFALYALSLAIALVSGHFGNVLTYNTQASYLAVDMLTNALGPMGSIWAVRALYALFNRRPGRLYAGLWIGYGGMLLLLVLGPHHPAHASAQTLLTLLAAAEQLRLTAGALRRRQRGAPIIAVGFAGGLLAALLMLTLLRDSSSRLQVNTVLFLVNMLAVLMYLLPALGISLFLAREFALDAELLQIKLGEVERLSARTLTQEQEKQALLAQQNETLEQQVEQRTGELRRSLTELRATQAQLIQKEKMASLGELTAGIAHEIQNPLNFVNNFAEVSTELMGELREAQTAGDAAEAATLAEDVDQNLLKISHHGQRAASIVRAMLEHSRQSAGERAPTDLNALAEEYLRLAYQGLRAKDKTFNAALHTDFAPGLPLVEAVGPEVGRVLLNLFSNAFYAVRQRQQTSTAPGYVPQVSVSSRQLAGGQVEIRVKDNGTGMSAATQTKIFQPFFTTKPTGEGTGLGLSLSYDIITKGHGGTLAVESQPGQGTTFTITLPC